MLEGKNCFLKNEFSNFEEMKIYRRSDSAGPYARFILMKDSGNLLKLLIGEGLHLLPNRSSSSRHVGSLNEQTFY